MRISRHTDFIENLTNDLAAATPRNQLTNLGFGPDLYPLLTAMPNKSSSQPVKRSLGQTLCCLQPRCFQRDKVDHVSWCELVFRLRVFNLNIEGFLNRHDDFNRVEPHNC